MDTQMGMDNDTSHSSSKSILLEDFQSPINEWKTLNDPVMGGKSYSNVVMEDSVAKFTGKCAIVPKLQAPGFITTETGNGFMEKPSKFPDISSCTAFQLELKTNTDYEGYRFSFGKAHVKGGRFAYGYKTPMKMKIMPPVGEFGTIVLPFHEFSDKWDDATGEIQVSCAEDPSFCPSDNWLKAMETISFWGEGVEGMVDLEIKSIVAIGCDSNASETPVSPAMLTSKMHTIGSNPFFRGIFLFGATVLVVCAMIIYWCSCCVQSRGKGRLAHSNSAAEMTGIYKDDDETGAAQDGFQDEPEKI